MPVVDVHHHRGDGPAPQTKAQRAVSQDEMMNLYMKWEGFYPLIRKVSLRVMLRCTIVFSSVPTNDSPHLKYMYCTVHSF